MLNDKDHEGKNKHRIQCVPGEMKGYDPIDRTNGCWEMHV